LVGEGESWADKVGLVEVRVDEGSAQSVLLLEREGGLVVCKTLCDNGIWLRVLGVDVDRELVVEERLRGVVVAVEGGSEQNGETDLCRAVEGGNKRGREERGARGVVGDSRGVVGGLVYGGRGVGFGFGVGGWLLWDAGDLLVEGEGC